MAIKPIDLQTLFVKMDEVSREQALVKEQSTLQQAQAARSQVVRELEEDRRVLRAPEENDVPTVKDEEERRRRNRRHRRSAERDRSVSSDGDKEIVTDPDVGKHVDLTG